MRKIWVRTLAPHLTLRKLGVMNVHFGYEPEEVDGDSVEIIRRIRQGNLEQVRGPGMAAMVDLPKEPKLMSTPSKGQE